MSASSCTCSASGWPRKCPWDTGRSMHNPGIFPEIETCARGAAVGHFATGLQFSGPLVRNSNYDVAEEVSSSPIFYPATVDELRTMAGRTCADSLRWRKMWRWCVSCLLYSRQAHSWQTAKPRRRRGTQRNLTRTALRPPAHAQMRASARSATMTQRCCSTCSSYMASSLIEA